MNKILIVIALLVTVEAVHADWYEVNQRERDRFDTMLMINATTSQTNSMWYSNQAGLTEQKTPQHEVKNDVEVYRTYVREKPLYQFGN